MHFTDGALAPSYLRPRSRVLSALRSQSIPLTVRYALRLVPVALLVACGGADLVLPGDGEPAAIEVVQGGGQTGRVGTALADPVVARVTDSQGRPVSGARVALVFTGDASGATVAPDTATTDTDGSASFQVVLGSRVGASTAEVRVRTGGGQRVLTAPLGFDAVSNDANQLVAVAGDSQSAAAGATLPEPLVVQVTDGFGNPIAGVPITWSADVGSVSEQTTATGSDGLASVQRTLGTDAGVQHATAEASGLAGSPVTFTQIASAGAAATLEPVSGDGQSAVVGTSVAEPLVVRARDAAGNPVAGMAVTWVVGNGGGSVSPQTSITGDGGLASTRWTVGGAPGPNSVTAVISGVGTVGFTATAQPGTPPSLSLATEPPASALRGVPFSRAPVIQLREPGGAVRRRSGVAVSVSLVAGGGSIRGTLTRATGSDGRVEFRDLALEGPPGSYALTFTATGYAGVSSGPIALSRAPTTVTVLSDEPDPSVTGTPVRVRFRVQSPGGTPTGTVSVSAGDGTSCSASVTTGECTLSPVAVGVRTLTASYSGSAEFESSAGVEAHVVEAPAPVGPSATRSTVAVADATLAAGQRTDVTVAVRDGGGAPLAGVGVTLSASGTGNTIDPGSATTGPDGTARFGFSSTDAGSKTLTAVAGGVTLAQQPTVTVASASPPSLAVRKQPSPTATPGVPFKDQPELQLRAGDGTNLDRAGVAVTASLASGTGSLTGTVVATSDDHGKVKFDDLGIAGAPGVYTIQFIADGFTPATSDPVELRLAATSTSIQSDDPDPSPVGTTVEVRYRITSDAGTPTGSVTVTSDAGESCTGTVADGGCSLVFSSPGTRTLTATYAGDGGFGASSGSEKHSVSASNAPPATSADAFGGAEDQALVVPAPGVLANDSDPDGDQLHASVASPPAHGTLTLAPDGGFSYTPAPDFSGVDGFTYVASDGSLVSSAVGVQLSIAPVNDAPSFQAGQDQSTIATSGPVTVPGWATAISPGPADETGQTLTFEVQVVSGGELFSAGPAVAPDGTLTYTPSGGTGTAQLSVTLHDSGGTAGGGVDTSPPQAFAITLTGAQAGV
jgi:hypothetical protein